MTTTNPDETIVITPISVSYSRLKKTKESYENERAEVTLQVPEGKHSLEVLSEARALVNMFLGIGPTESDIAKAKKVLAEAALTGGVS